MANDSSGANAPPAAQRPKAAKGGKSRQPATADRAEKTAKEAVAAKPAKAATPWGAASVVEQVTLEQEAEGREFASIVQLLETAEGERLVRFAYTTSGTARRGPVTLRPRDLDHLRRALVEHPQLADALRLGGGGA